ncbi:hypothetical protein HZF24_04455 [Sedimentibacter hydroxybenzoicus DSM 7310]|uniref:Uncharacterized protein n=1 Tax=Sedimentibacter hydroxybenzoicus DSM 7310 TaxID=1123245 RepID=A0A974GVH2_SEDHY|nr:hypothetical protein [Sedimentibacter hydroxybenzoicus]NYB73387.1 hypothetical protein [Sedimentibacter hydroxybenzoicus DSM 7310]
MIQLPKYKKELRQAIIDEVNSCKDVVALRVIYNIANLFRRIYGTNEEFATTSESERERYYIIHSILGTNDMKLLKCINAFANSYLFKSKMRKEKSKNAS